MSAPTATAPAPPVVPPVVVPRPLEAGQVVSLRSGGPHMTVHLVKEDRVAVCVWFDLAGLLHRDQFPLSSLVREVAKEDWPKVLAE